MAYLIVFILLTQLVAIISKEFPYNLTNKYGSIVSYSGDTYIKFYPLEFCVNITPITTFYIILFSFKYANNFGTKTVRIYFLNVGMALSF